MGNWTKCPIRNDKNGGRTRTQHSTVTQTIQPIPTTFHSRTERTTQQGRFFRFEKRIKRNGRRRLEENTLSFFENDFGGSSKSTNFEILNFQAVCEQLYWDKCFD